MSAHEFAPSIATMQASYTCYCGRQFASAASLSAHRGTDHGDEDVTRRFCPADNVCPACRVSFSNGKLLSHHLRYNAGFVCLLSCIAFFQPLSDDEVVAIREAERSLEAAREKVGLSRYLAIGAKTRVPGPLWPFFDSSGRVVLETSNLHPFGPNRRKYREAESDDEALDDEICPASRYAVCTTFCVLCRGV